MLPEFQKLYIVSPLCGYSLFLYMAISFHGRNTFKTHQYLLDFMVHLFKIALLWK